MEKEDHLPLRQREEMSLQVAHEWQWPHFMAPIGSVWAWGHLPAPRGNGTRTRVFQWYWTLEAEYYGIKGKTLYFIHKPSQKQDCGL